MFTQELSKLLFKSLQVLHGDIEEAICHHALFYAIWKKYDCLPERYNWMLRMPDVKFYPLRPELVESTYLLYQVSISLKMESFGEIWDLF